MQIHQYQVDAFLCSWYSSTASFPSFAIIDSIPACSNSDLAINWFVLLSSASNTQYGLSSFAGPDSPLVEGWEPDTAFRLKISRIPFSNIEGIIGFQIPISISYSLSLSNNLLSSLAKHNDLWNLDNFIIAAYSLNKAETTFRRNIIINNKQVKWLGKLPLAASSILKALTSEVVSSQCIPNPVK